MWINPEQISKKLSSISIDQIALSKKFTLRRGGKIDAKNFVLSFFLSIQGQNHSFTKWAQQLSLLIKETISYNAIKKAQKKLRVDFARALLDTALSSQIKDSKLSKWKTEYLDHFKRVFIEDSTCISLPKILYKFFPGAYSKTGKAATAKIQLRMELKTGTYSNIELKHYRNNDQSFAGAILNILKKGDLVIRDLGYAVIEIFSQIIDLKAFFISRFKYGVNIYDCQTGKEIDLAKLLRRARRNKSNVLDLHVLIGKKSKLKIRLCAIKCPTKVTRQRRAKAKKNRSKTANHSQQYFELLGWTIFITNVEQDQLSAQQILTTYGYRWRIEIVFKTWKTHFNLDQLFKGQAKYKKEQVEIAVYLFLTWVTLFLTRMYNFYLHKIYSTKKKIVSLMKFAKFVKEHILELLLNPNENFWIEHIAYYCCYKKRHDRLNFCEQVYLLK